MASGIGEVEVHRDVTQHDSGEPHEMLRRERIIHGFDRLRPLFGIVGDELVQVLVDLVDRHALRVGTAAAL